MRATLLRLVDAALVVVALATPFAAIAGIEASFSLDRCARVLGFVSLALAGPALAYVVRGGR